jgi:hypothetical protein
MKISDQETYKIPGSNETGHDQKNWENIDEYA